MRKHIASHDRRVKLDSGATTHVFGSHQRFNEDSLQSLPLVSTITDASGVKHPITAQGQVGMFQNVKLAQGLTADMISIGQLCDQTGKNILLTSDAAYLVPKIMNTRHTRSRRIKIANRGPDGLYDIDEQMLQPKALMAGKDTKPQSTLRLWHSRLGHWNHYSILRAINRGHITGITDKEIKEIKEDYGTETPCTACMRSKATRKHANI